MQKNPKIDGQSHSLLLPTWETFGQIEPIRRWTLELKKSTGNEVSVKQWGIVGRAVMILREDGALDEALLSKISLESGLDLVILEPDDFINMVNSNEYPADQSSALIYVKQGEWSAVTPSNNEPSPRVSDFRKALKDYLENINPKHSIVFVTSGKSYAELDESLRVVGAFDRRFLIPRLSLEDKGERFIQLLGRDICNQSLLSNLGKVGKLLEINFDDMRRQELIAIGMRRLQARKARKLEFDDLIYFSIHGSVETELVTEKNKSLIMRTALHEAGHALIAAIDSGGENIPDYLTIMPFEDTAGLTCDSYSFHFQGHGQQTFKDLRHCLRVQLAGRAAEEIIYGPENISAWGPRSDLINATKVGKRIIGLCGFTSNMLCKETNAENIAVIEDDPSPAEDAYLVKKIRQLLVQEYVVVRKMLEANQPALLAIEKALIKHTVLNQAELKSVIDQLIKVGEISIDSVNGSFKEVNTEKLSV